MASPLLPQELGGRERLLGSEDLTDQSCQMAIIVVEDRAVRRVFANIALLLRPRQVKVEVSLAYFFSCPCTSMVMVLRRLTGGEGQCAVWRCVVIAVWRCVGRANDMSR